MTSTDLIIIDSKSRSSGSPTSFKLALAENVNGTYELATFNMTNNIYNVITNENDKVYIVHSVDGANTASLSEGFYTAATLGAEIKIQLDLISAVVYTVTHNVTTGKFLISASSGNINFAFLSNILSTARYIMGFNEADGTPATSQTSDNAIDLKLHDIISIKIAQDNNAHTTLPDGTESSFIIQVKNTAFGEVLHFQKNSNFNQFAKFTSDISSLDIDLFAGDGDALNNNNAEWCMSLKKVFN